MACCILLTQLVPGVQPGCWRSRHCEQQMHTRIRVKTQARESAPQAGSKYLFSFTKRAVMRCVGALWPPPGSSTVALAKRSALVWQRTVENCMGLNVSLYPCQLKG